MLRNLNNKILSMYNDAFTGTRSNSKFSEDEIERQNAYNSETRLNDASGFLEHIKAVNEKLEKRIKDLEDVKDAADKAGVMFRYNSELEFLKELRG